MKSVFALAALGALVFVVQGTSQPGPPVPVLGSMCPCGTSSCRTDADCGAGGCCFSLSPHLQAKCCAKYNYLSMLRGRGACTPPPQERESYTKIGMCAPRYPPPKGAVACPYMLPSDDCRTDEDCPLGPGDIPQLCCPTDLKPGCYIGNRCTPPVLAG